MNILLLTKSKKYTCKLIETIKNRHHIAAVVCKNREILENTQMKELCDANNIPVISNNEMYAMLKARQMPKIDLAISNTYGRLIRSPLIDWVNGNCINLHGAVLPDYKGLFTYNHGLLNNETSWGVTAHYVNERFDAGDIIEIRRFQIDPENISVLELENLAQKTAYELTLSLIERWEKEGPLCGIAQMEQGNYYSREDFEAAKEVKITDAADVVKRKIHAFWCPPYEGAYIVIDGERFQLMEK